LERLPNYPPKKTTSPLQLTALLAAAGLFFAWERAYFLLAFAALFLLSRRKYLFLLPLGVAFLYGHFIFPPPGIPPLQRETKVLRARLETPLEEASFSKRGKVRLLPTGEKAVFYFPRRLSLSPGQVFEAEVRLKSPRSALNPFAPDFSRLKRARGIKWIGSVKKILRLGPIREVNPLSALRERLFSFAKGLSPPARGLFEALVLGSKRNLPEPLKETFSRLGIFHFLAISGLHLALLLGLVSFLLKGIFWCWPRPLLALTFKQWLILAATPPLLLYAYLSGPTPSALRALLMFLLWGGALLFLRELSGFDLLALTVLLILLWQPEAVGSYSFRLSVSAVWALFLFQEKAGPFLAKGRWLSRYLKEGLGYAAAASLATLPWLLALKGYASPWAPLTNLLALPIFGFFVLPLELAAALLALLGQDFAASLAEKAALVTNLPPLDLPQLTPPFPLGVFLIVLFLPFTFAILKGKKGLKWGIPASLALGTFFSVTYGSLSYILVLDVGEGSAALAKVEGHRALLFDAGPRWGRFDAARLVVLPTLKKLSLSPSTVVISHFQTDHAGGLEALREEYPEMAVLSPQSPENSLLRGKGWRLFLFRAPEFRSPNEASLVSLLEISGIRVLFPGDIGKKRERLLLKEEISADVLILPHHGARGSSSYPFLKKVSPKLALSSARSVKHPAPQTLRRLAKLEIPHASTKEHGAASVFWEGKRLWLCLEDERRKRPLLLRALWPYLKVGCHPLPAAPQDAY